MKKRAKKVKPGLNKLKGIKKKKDKLRLGGRKTANNQELWERRVAEYRLYAMGLNLTEIAAQYNITKQAVSEDLKAVAALEPPIKAKHQVEQAFTEIIRKAFAREENAPSSEKAALLHTAMEAITRKAKLSGLLKDGPQVRNLINTIGAINNERNGYEGRKNKDLIDEFKRRKKFNKK